ncbi:zinc transporter ZIP1-like isoform X2 [Chrysoperla carnea]|uniref:zinc transporter ZIP1-like isoform X2 n=1 Tax=Chrysoperla carnea TaxID=189513 RepID=UPI001D063E65|nr:zinc transporter ZIP1-like isoform X2 [Chrysoperla carnea]
MDFHTHSDVHILHAEDAEEGVMIAKITAMFTLFLSSMFMGLLPIKLSKVFKWQQISDVKSHKFVSLLLSFGGGVLLCTTFQHLLPEVNESIEELQEHVENFPEFRFHLGEFLMCAGFFIIYFVEELVHLYLHYREHHVCDSELTSVFQRSISIRRSQMKNETTPTTMSTTDLLNPETGVAIKIPIDQHCPTLDQKHIGHSHMILPTSSNEDPFVTNLRGLLVVLALSVHELFEGLAVGLEKSTSNVWYMFAAVSAHKLVIAFCVGVELIATKTRISLTVLYVFVFAVVSPLGIGIGIGLSITEDPDHVTDIASMILQGLATGTLLYVVFFEVLQVERQGFRQFLAILVGFMVMFALQFLTGHEHSHSHGDADHIINATNLTSSEHMAHPHQ